MKLYKCVYKLMMPSDSEMFVLAESWEEALRKFGAEISIVNLNAIELIANAVV